MSGALRGSTSGGSAAIATPLTPTTSATTTPPVLTTPPRPKPCQNHIATNSQEQDRPSEFGKIKLTDWNSEEKRSLRRLRRAAAEPAAAPKAAVQLVEHQIDHRRGVESEHLAHHESADDGHAERPAQLRPRARRDEQRHRAEQRRHRRHQDRAEARHA